MVGKPKICINRYLGGLGRGSIILARDFCCSEVQSWMLCWLSCCHVVYSDLGL
jgi:hypothetical protein